MSLSARLILCHFARHKFLRHSWPTLDSFVHIACINFWYRVLSPEKYVLRSEECRPRRVHFRRRIHLNNRIVLRSLPDPIAANYASPCNEIARDTLAREPRESSSRNGIFRFAEPFHDARQISSITFRDKLTRDTTICKRFHPRWRTIFFLAFILLS